VRRFLALVVALTLLVTVAFADTPKTSIRPKQRPVAQADYVPLTPETQLVHPKPRPTALAVLPAIAVVNVQPTPVQPVEAKSIIKPRPRPKNLSAIVIETAAAPASNAAEKVQNKEKRSRKGSVCGDPDIRGEALPRIGSKTKGCGVEEPVKVTAIDGISFSQPATIDCATAKATKKWIEKGLRPAFGNREVVQLHIFGSYMCRSRNNVRGAKISEHGHGKAIDFAGFIFADGKEWTVTRDYNKTIRKAQKAACGIFGTTLGPGSDGYHEDHLHFDTASYRSGAYCR
jgi:hypothetical protein